MSTPSPEVSNWIQHGQATRRGGCGEGEGAIQEQALGQRAHRGQNAVHPSPPHFALLKGGWGEGGVGDGAGPCDDHVFGWRVRCVLQIIVKAAKTLDECQMVRFEERRGKGRGGQVRIITLESKPD